MFGGHRTLTVISRGAVWLVGGVLIFSALAKAETPWPVQLVLAHVLKRLDLLDTDTRTYPIVVGLVLFEIALGAWLISGWRAGAARRTTFFTLGAFTLFLVTLVFDPAAPPCACTGGIKLADDAQTANLLGVGRNLVLIALLAMGANGARAARSAGGRRGGSVGHAPAGSEAGADENVNVAPV